MKGLERHRQNVIRRRQQQTIPNVNEGHLSHLRTSNGRKLLQCLVRVIILSISIQIIISGFINMGTFEHGNENQKRISLHSKDITPPFPERLKIAALPPVWSSHSCESNSSPNRGVSTTKSRIPPSLQFICDDPAIKFIQVASPNKSRSERTAPKVLCVILTHSENHKTRIQTILDTWGRKCDGFVAASNQTDLTYHAHNIVLPRRHRNAGYWGIYIKLMYTLRSILHSTMPSSVSVTSSNVLHDFDWILKADDDTYVIMENLHAFLENQTSLLSDNIYKTPIIYGRTMPWPLLSELPSFGGWFETPEEKDFQRRFYQRFNDTRQRLVYTHGGPGYLMNREYTKILVDAFFDSKDAVKGEISEDMANAFNMMYRNITPRSTGEEIVTKDGANSKTTIRERSHPESPRTMYENPHWLPWVQSNIQNRGDGSDCCSISSISYHHVTPLEMRLLEHQLYTCRE